MSVNSLKKFGVRLISWYNSKGKVGKQKLGNNLLFLAAIQEGWYGLDLKDDRIRTLLKYTYFNYLTNG